MRFITFNVKYFYLMIHMEQYEYMQLKLANLPKDVIKKYNLRERVTKNGYVYLKISQGVYGILQAGMMAQKQLGKRLKAEG